MCLPECRGGTPAKNEKQQSATCRFVVAARMPGATAAHSGVVLADGKVLVTGGYSKLFGRLPFASTLGRIYDPRPSKMELPDAEKEYPWRLTEGGMNYGRLLHNSILLPGGKVLIAGGIGQHGRPLRSMELYDPKTEQFTVLPEMSVARKNPGLNLLADGKVLITGSSLRGDIFEVSKEAPSGYRVRQTKGQAMVKHTDHACLTLKDGTVLLITGRNDCLERFDPCTESFMLCRVKMPQVYDDQAAAVLYNGKVLIAGGQEVFSNRCTNLAWIYDPQTDTLVDGPVLVPTSKGIRQDGVSDLGVVDLFLPVRGESSSKENKSGHFILFCGGEYDPGKGPQKDTILDSAWIYDAKRNQFLDVGPMLTGHDDFAAVALLAERDHSGQMNCHGRVLIMGGYGADDLFQANCEIFCWNPECLSSK